MQSLRPGSVLVSCVSPDDVDPATACVTRVITSAPGLTRQRNAILRELPAGTEYLVFFDDDFVAHEDWLRRAKDLFELNPDVVGLTGRVIVDGIHGPGVSFTEAVAAIQQAGDGEEGGPLVDYSPYGCNMAFRVSALEGLSFDERLVLYGWQEDRDFGAQVARRGRVVKASGLLGVHMGVKGGRVSGRRLGYSQIANPIHLLRKGTMSAGTLVDHIGRNVAKNVIRSVFAEPHIDRRGRLHGNLIAVGDLFRGRLAPERAESL